MQPEHRLIWSELELYWLRLAETVEARHAINPITTLIVTGSHRSHEREESSPGAGGPMSAGMKVKMVANTTARDRSKS